jgi:hypothetical protein
LIVLGAIATGAQGASSDARGCEGLDAYRAAITAARSSDQYIRVTPPPEGDWDAVTPEDWTALADNFWMLNAELKAIDPPIFATAWHEATIDLNRRLVGVARAVVHGGEAAAEPLAAGFLAAVDAQEVAAVAGGGICLAFRDAIADYEKHPLGW